MRFIGWFVSRNFTCRQVCLIQVLLHINSWLFFVIVDLHKGGGVHGTFKGISNYDTNMLAAIQHNVILQQLQFATAPFFSRSLWRVEMGYNCQHTWYLLSCLCINLSNFTFSDPTLNRYPIRHFSDWKLSRITCAACYFKISIDPIQRSADNSVCLVCIHAISPTVVSARTIVRLASSILNPLYFCGLAPEIAAFAAA